VTFFVATILGKDEDILGTLILFQLPSSSMLCTSHRNEKTHNTTSKFSSSSSSFLNKTLKCANVRLGGWSAHTLRNLLWPTNIVPRGTNSNSERYFKSFPSSEGVSKYSHPATYLCDSFIETSSAYLLFNDEDDGYRMTWAVFPMVDNGGVVIHSPQKIEKLLSKAGVFKIQPERNDIVTVTDEHVWEEFWSDSRTGCATSQISSLDIIDDRHFHIGFEAYLHIDALLSDLILRRRNILSPNFFTGDINEEEVSLRGLPDFFYNLVSVSCDGRVVTLVIVFGNGQSLGMAGNHLMRGGSNNKHTKTPASFGVFLYIDIFNQSYEEDEWVQHPSRFETVFLRQWCNTLALNRRMKEMRVGVFCVGQDDLSVKGGSLPLGAVKTHESNTGEDEASDRNPDIWRQYANRSGLSSKLSNKMEPPKEVAMSSLYPYCDVVTNRAVLSCKPVSKIRCRNSPVELCYG